MRYAAEQAHLLVQGSYKFNETAEVAAALSALDWTPLRTIRIQGRSSLFAGLSRCRLCHAFDGLMRA